MARLAANSPWLLQEIDGNVVLFNEGPETEIVNYPIGDMQAAAKAQKTIYDSPLLSAEEKCFAHFWCGYYYANAGSY